MTRKNKNTTDFYVVGGTMKPGSPSYIERKADKELYKHILKGDFCYVLTPRQMGKSSLMARTADRLKKENLRTAIVDLSQIGTEKEKESAEKWYYGITHRIVRELDIKVKLSDWWRDREKLPALQRLTEFFEDVLLLETHEPVVIFVDEIDTTISLPFTDDFFAAIRACYNSRATKLAYQRLNFVLLGVAGPSDLIKDTQRTPFNIGQRIHLTDFTPTEAQPLAEGLCTDRQQGKEILKRILYWSGGHPYLTQKLCSLLANEKMDTYNTANIDTIVEKNFLLPGVNREESNLKFVSDRLLENKRISIKLLNLYQRIYQGKLIADEPLSPIHTVLKLSGLVVSGINRRLAIRNRIYEKTFTRKWVKEVIPIDWNRIMAMAAVTVLLIGFAIWYTLLLPTPYIQAIRSAKDDVPNEPYNKLKGILFYKTTADNLFADYWHRRALRNVSLGNRDQGLLYHLKALKVKDLNNYRSEATLIIADDYENLKVTYRHNSRISSVALSPDGKNILTGYWDGTASLWDTTTGKSVLSPLKHEGILGVTSIAFSPDGKIVLSGGSDGIARFWCVATGKQVSPPLKHGVCIDSVAFSPDGKTILTGSSNCTARLWDRATRKSVSPPMKHGLRITSVAFSSDGKTVLTGSLDCTARLWDVATGKSVSPPMKHIEWVTSVAFSPDDKTILTGSTDGTVWLWIAKTGKTLRSSKKHDSRVSFVAFSPDGKTILTGSLDGQARLWDAATGKSMSPPMMHISGIHSVAFSPDGKTVFTGSIDGMVRLWDVVERKSLFSPLIYGDKVYCVTFSPDGKTVLTGSLDGTAQTWDVATGKSVSPPMKHSPLIYSVAFSPDGKTILTGGLDGTVRMWDETTGNLLLSSLNLSSRVSVYSLAFSPDSKTFLTGCSDGTVQLWDTATGRSVLPPMKHGSRIFSVTFSPDGKTVLTGCSDGTALLWDTVKGKSVSPLMKHGDFSNVSSIAFSPDGKTILTGGDDGTVRLWEAATGKSLFPPIKTGDKFSSVAFSPDGKTIAVVTNWWIHQYFLQDRKMKPKASRLLHGKSTCAFHFLDDKGDQMQVVVRPTGDSIKIVNLRFDIPDAPPIQGDPAELLELWQKKLALKLDEKTGEIQPMYPLPKAEDYFPRSQTVKIPVEK